ncbi:MAG: glycosyl hydrolase 43 family protein [Bacteroidaceae bacterium]|nr:glycosyl hydrolase 43 family protein [Bacteroidaceae bacterium]
MTYSASAQVRWGEWTTWGDQHDGTYRNPVVPADFSDLDCIRVGKDYYAITSTFQYSPGVTIIHSRDLVNWEYVTNAVTDLTQIGPELSWKRMNRYNTGIWAGTIRHHNGRFYLFFGCPDEGFFMTSAPKAEGPWAPLTALLPERGWDDCSAYWDTDGKAYFIGTHFADNYKSYLFPMTADGTSIDRTKAQLVNEGSGREASKIIHHDGYYYIIFSEHRGGVGRYVLAKRSRSMQGPWEERQLAYASVEANEPNQGGIVQGPNGRWYFLTHHGSGDWSGRIMSLLPVTWSDGWPIIGCICEGETMGRMQWTDALPARKSAKVSLATSDEFKAKKLSPQWQWNYQPREEFYSLTERKGYMRLRAFRPLEPNRMLKAGNTFSQRVFRTPSRVTACIDLRGTAKGLHGGLIHFSEHYTSLGIFDAGNDEAGRVRSLELRHADRVLESIPLPAGQQRLWLRSEWGVEGQAQFSFSLDGWSFVPVGKPHWLEWSFYRGDRIGFYCYNDEDEQGYIDIDFFHYDK